MNDQQQEAIKPCRFCGRDGYLDTTPLHGKSASRVTCGGVYECAIRGPMLDDPQAAIAAWNSIHAPAEPQREEGVVAWMNRGRWNKRGVHDVVVGEWCNHPGYPMRVRIIPEPEPQPAPRPRYEVEVRADYWTVADRRQGMIVSWYSKDRHPDAEARARADADDLNRRESGPRSETPRYYADVQGDAATVVDRSTNEVAARFPGGHPNSLSAACAEAERLNRGKAHGHD